MPTRLGKFGPRNFANKAYQDALTHQVAGPGVQFIAPPWPGYEPDLDPKCATPGAAKNCINLIDREGTLTVDDGYARVDAAHLPLDSGHAVVGLGFGYNRNGSYPGDLRRLAVTTQKLYELSGGVWTDRPYVNTTAGSTALNLNAADLIDMVYFPAGDYTVICSGPDKNDVYRFPEAAAGTHYTELYNIVAFGHFRAKSVTVHEDRLVYLNTIENGANFRTRCRWTSKGANATIDETVTGTGFGDFNEFSGIGLKAIPIGVKLALYFEDGVQFLSRTGRATDAYQRDYATHERGLMSTKSVVSVGSGIHFGIFTDGWYFATTDGGWSERGITSTDKGDTYYKWKDTFYNAINWEQRGRVVIDYDAPTKSILIAFPTGSATGPSTLWRYDLVSDRVFPLSGEHVPNILGRFQEQLTTGTTWAAAIPSWAATTAGWDSMAGARGAERVAFGTPDGLVFQYRAPAFGKTRDGLDPAWFYETHPFDVGLPHLYKRVNRVFVGYTRQVAPNPSAISTQLISNNGEIVSGSINPSKGNQGTRQTDFVSGVASGQQFSITVAGGGDVGIERLGVEMVMEDSKVLRKGVGT